MPRLEGFGAFSNNTSEQTDRINIKSWTEPEKFALFVCQSGKIRFGSCPRRMNGDSNSIVVYDRRFLEDAQNSVGKFPNGNWKHCQLTKSKSIHKNHTTHSQFLKTEPVILLCEKMLRIIINCCSNLYPYNLGLVDFQLDSSKPLL